MVVFHISNNFENNPLSCQNFVFVIDSLNGISHPRRHLSHAFGLYILFHISILYIFIV